MDFYRKVRAQQEQVDDGTLKVSVFTEDGTRPVEDETLSFESCFSSELMLCAIPHLSGVCGGGAASPHLLTTMW